MLEETLRAERVGIDWGSWVDLSGLQMLPRGQFWACLRCKESSPSGWGPGSRRDGEQSEDKMTLWWVKSALRQQTGHGCLVEVLPQFPFL